MAPPAGLLRVVAIDAHPVLRCGLAALFDRQPDLALVGQGGAERAAFALTREHAPDVILLDAQLGERSAGDVCRALHREFPTLAILLLSAVDDDRARFDAMLAGASGYLTKSSPPEGLLDAVRRVGAGESLFDADTAGQLLARLGRQGPGADARLQRLKPAELRILHLVSRGYTNRQIASRVNLAERTVKKYVSSILSKLGVSSRAGAAAYLAERAGGGPFVPSATNEEHQAILDELRLQSEQLLADRDGLEAERERYEDLYRHAPVPYLVTDPVGLIVCANHRAAQLLGLSEAQLARRPLANFVTPALRRGFRERLGSFESQAEWPLALQQAQVTARVSAVRDSDGACSELRWVLTPAYRGSESQ